MTGDSQKAAQEVAEATGERSERNTDAGNANSSYVLLMFKHHVKHVEPTIWSPSFTSLLKSLHIKKINKCIIAMLVIQNRYSCLGIIYWWQ